MALEIDYISRCIVLPQTSSFNSVNKMMAKSIKHKISIWLALLLSNGFIATHSIDFGIQSQLNSSLETELFDSTQTVGPIGKDGGNYQPYPSRQFETRSSGNDFIVEAKIPVIEFTDGPYARIFGKQVNYTETTPFGEEILTVVEFKGIPYAEAAIQSLRFQRPILKLPQDGFRALYPSNPCPQISSSGFIGNEDCLHLSIYIPYGEKNGGKLPVLVWFHGESMGRLKSAQLSMFSSGSSEDLHPYIFLKNNVIVITPQYRLGSLGFLSVANEDLNGNMGLFDQILALEWIQKYISYFGGDPTQITVMGQGSAAIALGLLATSGEVARGLFQRIILMSGSPLSPFALDVNEKLTFAEVALQNSCPSFPTLQFVRCMQSKEMKSIVLADENLTKGRHLGKFRSPLPVIQKEDDMRFLPPLIYAQPESKLKDGLFIDVPIIIGVTRSELFGFLSSVTGKPDSFLGEKLFKEGNVLRQFIRAILTRSKLELDGDMMAKLTSFEYFAGLNISERGEQAKDLLEELIADYLFYIPALSLANLWSRVVPAYFYLFDYIPTGSSNDPETEEDRSYFRRRRQDENANFIQAGHGSDLRFLMEGYKGSAQDRDIWNIMAHSLVNFIHKGTPLQSGLDWPQYREDSKEYLYFGESIQTRKRFRGRQEQFWTGLLKDIGDKAGKNSCRATKN